MMIKNAKNLSFLMLTGMLGGSSGSGTSVAGSAAEGEALLSLEAAADDPNYDHHGHKPLLRGGQLAKFATRLDSREYNGDNTIPSFVKHLFQVDNDSESCCGECWCIPDNGGECPASLTIILRSTQMK